MPTKILEIMRKLLLLGIFVSSLSLMSFTSTAKSKQVIKKQPKLVTHTCPNGYQFEYYEGLSGWTQDDYDEIIDAVCNDPANQP